MDNGIPGGQDGFLVMADADGPDSLLQFGWGPLPSPTASDSFAIFDFYNRAGSPWSFAANSAEGILTSPVIDLTGNQFVEVNLWQQIYWCCEIGWSATMDISTDGGLTFPNSKVLSVSSRNDRHWELGLGYEFSFDISDEIAADPSNVVLRFNWSGLNADQNGQFTNAYFWMIDDITIQNLPDHQFKPVELFVENSTGTQVKVSEPNRIISDPSSNTYHPTYGQVTLENVVPLQFTSNAFNYGGQTQTNAFLQVEILDYNMQRIDTLNSPMIDSIQRGDSALFDVSRTTRTWTPTDTGTYHFLYRVLSDSIGNGAGTSP
ncbi:MAG: hypothetical protein U5L96_18935 [Owenweeksia sp.]|nr:hypothetical protein [Owenweeksia sp.]